MRNFSMLSSLSVSTHNVIDNNFEITITFTANFSYSYRSEVFTLLLRTFKDTVLNFKKVTVRVEFDLNKQISCYMK